MWSARENLVTLEEEHLTSSNLGGYPVNISSVVDRVQFRLSVERMGFCFSMALRYILTYHVRMGVS